jgi:hypothetical protein
MTDTIMKTEPLAISPSTPPPALASYFSRKIGNTTFVVSVLFSEKATESMDDKILRLVASDIQQGEVKQCV